LIFANLPTRCLLVSSFCCHFTLAHRGALGHAHSHSALTGTLIGAHANGHQAREINGRLVTGADAVEAAAITTRAASSGTLGTSATSRGFGAVLVRVYFKALLDEGEAAAV